MSAADTTRVLLLAPCFGEYGGIEAFMFAVAEMVGGDSRFEVRVCFKRVSRFAMGATLEPYCDDPRVVFCDRASAGLWAQVAWADVIHAQNASPDVALMCALQRKPLAVTIHDFLPAVPRWRRLSWQAAAGVAAVRWYNSDAVRRTWEAAARRRSAIVPTVSRLSDAYIAPADRRGFVFVGRLVDSKGVEPLIDAYADAGLDDARTPLRIVGDGPMRPALEARVARRALRHVSFAGFVADSAKALAIASARWLVAPSHAHEGLGLVVLEARHAGVPCIVTNHGGLPEAGGPDALRCVANDVASLRDALVAAATMDDAEYRARSERTRRELATQLVDRGFYGRAYLELRGGGR
jgi:glycosyltransferase involved in cell wall biosynthesis